jgi:hypothetical protein
MSIRQRFDGAVFSTELGQLGAYEEFDKRGLMTDRPT